MTTKSSPLQFDAGDSKPAENATQAIARKNFRIGQKRQKWSKMADLPQGTRVRISPVPQEMPETFGERFARFKGAVTDLPWDLAEQHEHYRLGTPKR